MTINGYEDTRVVKVSITIPLEYQDGVLTNGNKSFTLQSIHDEINRPDEDEVVENEENENGLDSIIGDED